MNACFRRVLTDGWEGVYEEDYRLSSSNFVGMDGASWSISKYTLKGGKQHSVDLVEIDNGYMTVVVVPTRGMNVLEAFTDEIALGWNSPVKEVVHPAYVTEESRGNLGWLEGFNELVARCGLSWHGAPGEDSVVTNTGKKASVVLPLHGTISNTPAVRLSVEVSLEMPHAISVVGEMYDTRMFGPSYRLIGRVSTTPGSSEFVIHDRIENIGGSPAEMEVLYHSNYGPPMLGDGAQLLAPVEFLCPINARAAEDISNWDTFGPPQTGFAEQCYLGRLHSDRRGQTLVALVDPSGENAATIRYSVEQLPAFTIWRNAAAEADGYVVGLEPGTDYPNARMFERRKGRVIQVPGGGVFEASLTYGIVRGGPSIARLEEEVKELTEGKESTVATAPDPDYSPA